MININLELSGVGTFLVDLPAVPHAGDWLMHEKYKYQVKEVIFAADSRTVVVKAR